MAERSYRDATTPFVVRVVTGDITVARASVLVVNHFNGVPIGGAEAAIDAALSGAISRRAAIGALDSPFGTTQFLPAATATLAARAVLVISLGDPERFNPERLPEVGTAMVEALASFAFRDAATIVHGAGSVGVPEEQATRDLLGGVLAALVDVPGADCLRELSIVQRNPEQVAGVIRGVRTARGSPRVHVYVEEEVLPMPAQPSPTAPSLDAVPAHVRIGVTRAGANLKVTVIGDGSYDCAEETGYPSLATNLMDDLQEQVLEPTSDDERANALACIGEQLQRAYLGWDGSPALAAIDKADSRYLVLRLDRSTAGLPWELLFHGEKFLALGWRLSRQLELQASGRAVAPAGAGDQLRVLVIGDPSADLPNARAEAAAVAEKLGSLDGASVTALIGGTKARSQVTYEDVSAALNTSDYDIVHYAGHGAFDLLGKSGGLVLADHVLTAADMATRRHLPRTFFANACHAGRTGDNPFSGAEPTLDLAQGLLRTGVRHFLGAKWAVDDAAAATFALAFYDAIVADRHEPAGEAVRLARSAVVDTHGPGQPAWATYALYGCPWEPLL